MDEYVYVLCAMLFVIAVGWGTEHAERALLPPHTYFSSRFCETHFRTGDVLVWVSAPSLGGDALKLMCRNSITHVSLVFVDKSGMPFVWESMWFGNRVIPLFRTLQKRTAAGQTCMLRKLTHLVDSRACEQFIRANLHKPYSYSSWRSMVRRWVGVMHMPQWTRRDNDAMFCSQLVAETLQHLGALDFSGADKKPAMLLPADFSPESTATFPWVAPYNLGPLILINV